MKLLFGIFFTLIAIQLNAEDALHRRKILSPFIVPQTKKVKILFMDADSTLRVSRSEAVSANGPNDYVILPFVPAILKKYSEAGYFLAIVSNQLGVSQGHVTIEFADEALLNLTNDLKKLGATIHYFDYATGWGSERKPDIGMALRLEGILKSTFGEDITIDKEGSLMVGDSDYKKEVDIRPDGLPGKAFSNADRLFATNLGIPFVPPEIFFGWKTFGIDRIESLPDFRKFAEDLLPSCENLLKGFSTI